MSCSPKAAFFGDSNFPKSALQYYKAGRIIFFQNLFERYSSLNFTHSTDRSVAIAGLEKRLIRTLDTKGGFGVLDLFLGRSLLWSRTSHGFLERVTYPANRSVPSWSWMACDGAITFLAPPMEGVIWTKDKEYESPFTTDSAAQGRNHWQTNGSGRTYALAAKARKLRVGSSGILGGIVFDRRDCTLEDLRCVVIGKTRQDAAQRDWYVLVIERMGPPGSSRYTRVGVGRLLEEHIVLDECEQVEVV